jgi:superfamily II DNA/RNA helicase
MLSADLFQGCNVPDVDIVIQWKAPTNISSWVQRAGRAARAPGRQGLAVMIVEKSIFELNVNATEEAVEAPTPPMRRRGQGQGRGRGRGQRGRGRGVRGKRGGAGYAV